MKTSKGYTRIGLVIRPHIEAAVDIAKKLASWCKQRQLELLLEEESAKTFPVSASGRRRAQDLARDADVIVALGGDGTLIRVAKYVTGPKPVLLGVNFGNLGFLTELSPKELFPVLEEAIAGKLQTGERHMLQAKVMRSGKQIFASQAVNDVVVQKGARDPLIELDVGVNKEALVRIRADGLIISTPTGSTAYSLAAGGSIVYPLLATMMLTPICAHSLTLRPIILPLDVEMVVSLPQYHGEILITIDGQISEHLQPGDVIHVSKALHTVRFAPSPSLSYFEILRGKLNWGIVHPLE